MSRAERAADVAALPPTVPMPDPPEMGTAEAIGKLAEAILAQAPKSPLEMAGLSKERQRQLTEPPKPQQYRRIKCVSPETGATFVANVVASAKMPNGRVTQLLEYRMPAGRYKFVSNGGVVPDGHPILKDSPGEPSVDDEKEIPKEQLHPAYLAFRWTDYYKADLSRIVGKEIKSHICADSDALKTTEWIEGTVGAVTE